jgi:hypothetical protein
VVLRTFHSRGASPARTRQDGEVSVPSTGHSHFSQRGPWYPCSLPAVPGGSSPLLHLSLPETKSLPFSHFMPAMDGAAESSVDPTEQGQLSCVWHSVPRLCTCCSFHCNTVPSTDLPVTVSLQLKG